MSPRAGPDADQRLSLAIVVEDKPDYEMATVLADRVCTERGPDWLRDFEEKMDLLRSFSGLEPGSDFSKWTEVKKLADSERLGRRVHGKFDGKPGASYSQATRKAIVLASMLSGTMAPPDALFLLSDSDGDLGARKGLYQAREEQEKKVSFQIIIGVPHPRREAWVLNGFVPRDETERARLEKLRQQRQLGFDPCEEAERLTAKGDKPEAKRNAKEVLRELVCDSRERERLCLEQCPLEELERRGRRTHLADYLSEVQARLIPLFNSVSG